MNSTYYELVSVIIPIYNVEQYLKECIDSILNQTYRNLEIILVDDGSPDRCGEICDEYARKDNRIIVIHKKNGGLSDARNKGIDIATGDYYAFIDSDDCIAYNFIEILLRICKENQCEIAQCGFQKFQHDYKNELIEVNYKPHIYTEQEISLQLLNKVFNAESVVWTKLYSSSCFDKLRFPYGKIYEDIFTIHELLYKSNKIGKIDTPLYFYRTNPSSITRQKWNYKRLDMVEGHKKRLDFYYEINNEELYNLQKRWYLLSIVWNYCNLCCYTDASKEIKQKLLSDFKYIKVKCDKYLMKALRKPLIKFYLCVYFPDLYRILWKISKYTKVSRIR